MPLTPPTRVTSAASSWTTNSTPLSVTVNSLVTGDLLIAEWAAADANVIFSTISTSAGSTSAWNNLVELNGTPGSGGEVHIRWATASANGNVTVQASTTGGTEPRGFTVIVYRDHNGVSANTGSKSIASPSTSTMDCTFTTLNDNSAIEVFSMDWTANTTSPTTSDEREVQAGNETTTNLFPGDGSTYGVFGGYYADAGTAGSKTVGWSITRAPVLGAIEIIGLAGAATPQAIEARDDFETPRIGPF